MAKTVSITELKAASSRIIDQISRDDQPITITKRGKPVAVLSPVRPDGKPASIWGAMRGTVLRYDEPFAPAIDPTVWYRTSPP